MNSESPGWQPVDPSGPSLSAALPEAPRSGEVVVFASIASEDQQNWAAGTVAEIVREWADRVDRLLLMDLDLQGPGIHHALDADPAEGASDVLLFGASLSRVSQALDGGSFHFAPAGTPVADSGVILSNSGWNRILQGLEENGVALVLHLPLRQSGAPSILDRADRIIQLGRSAEGGQGIRSEYEDRVVARLTPPDLAAGPVVDIATLAPDPGPAAPEEDVVDIRALAPDGVSPEGRSTEKVEASQAPTLSAADEAEEDEDAEAEEVAAVGVEGPVVEIAELAPDEPMATDDRGALPESGPPSDEAVESAVEEATAEARDRPAEESPGEIGEPELDESRGRAVEIEGGEAEIVGPVVDIADLAPDQPVGVARPADEGVGIPTDQAGVEDEVAAFPEEPSPEAEVEDRVVPFGPESGEVEEVAPEDSGGSSFQEDEFAAGLDAIDAAAEAGKPTGMEGFDLEELDQLADTGGVPEEVEEEEDDRSVDAEEGAESVRFESDAPEEPGEAAPPVDETPFAAEEDALRTDEEAFAPDEDEDALGAEEDVFGAEEQAFGSDEGAFPSDEEAFPSDEEAFAADEDAFSPDDGAFAADQETFAADEEAPAESDEEAGFGAFSGELDGDEPGVDEEEPAGFGEGLDGDDVIPPEDFGEGEGTSDAERPFEPGPFEEEPGAGELGGEDDLASDLVTGPDFGQSVSDDEGIWDEDEPGAGRTDATSRDAAAETTGDAGGMSGPAAPAREREGVGEGGPRGAEEGEPRLVGTEEVTGPKRSRESGRPLRLLALAILLAVSAVAAHWYGVVDVPGLDRALGAILGPAGTGVAPTVDTSAPQPTSPIQSRSLLIDVYRDGQSAGDVALALQERLPDRIFAVAPVQEDGNIIFRLLAGPADDAEQAAALRQTLAEVLTREDPSQWTPQGTSLAFVIDELPNAQAASDRASAVTGGTVFGYVLPVSYPDGSTAYRVYAGGYSSAEEARALQGFLSQAGLGGAPFTERRGEVPE